jgi:hypothetical protein
MKKRGWCGPCHHRCGLKLEVENEKVEHGWWYLEQEGKMPSLFGAFESNANNLCPDDHKLVSKEIGTWPHTALLCRINRG